MPTWQAVAIGIIPSIGVGLVFWFAMRAVVRADRNERAALAKADAEQSAERAQSETNAVPDADVRSAASDGESQD
ncbi:hypothetical protein ON058_09720 [Demequina sp. B12]|uniref:hypothetical protein n=1 Tax=Demequina sp. B12 TaxID=2992757 RepID=UPI00237C2EEB|nr:hypothetical protein [Demequina sp. B12]MDE0573691.1 hypothetical protein [Demequina sp. B12]